MGLLTKRREISWFLILHHQMKATHQFSLPKYWSLDDRRSVHCIFDLQSLQTAPAIDPYRRIHEILRDCRRWGACISGMNLHCVLIKGGLSRDVFVANNLISMYSGFRFIAFARQVFNEMSVRNVASWTSLISCYSNFGMPEEALRVFQWMLLEREQPNCFTLATMLKACAALEDLEMGKMIHDTACREGLRHDVVLMNSILHMYAKCGSLNDARRVFDEMPVRNVASWNTMIAGYMMEGLMEQGARLLDVMPEPDIVSWNTMIAGYARKGTWEMVLNYVRQMHKFFVNLDQFTFPCALEACGCLKIVTVGKQMHAYAIQCGFETSCFVTTALVDMYSECNFVNEAYKLFVSYSNQNDSSLWNAMLSSYTNNGHIHDAMNLFLEMHICGLLLDYFTYVGILKACIEVLNLCLGHQVHGLVVKSRLESDVVLVSLLVDLYASCGKIRVAWKLFYGLPKPDLVACTGMITACVQQGFNSLALSLFRDMVRIKLPIDHFVMSCTLKACSSLSSLEGGKQVHACIVKNGCDLEAVTQTALIDMYCKCGQVEDGRTLFEGLTRRDTVCWTGIITGCAQHGRAKEAIDYFKNMVDSGIAPNEMTFASVLSACRHSGLIEEAWIYFMSMHKKYGLVPRMEHYCCMVDLLGQAQLFEEAERLISSMPFQPDETIWRSLLGACTIHGNVRLGKCAVKHLLEIVPHDTSAYVTLSNMHASLGMWNESATYKEVVRIIGNREPGKSWIEMRADN